MNRSGATAPALSVADAIGYDRAMSIDAPLALYETSVRPEWLDLNDHMNVAYYVLAFDYGTDALYDFVGVGEQYIATRGGSMFALECHVTYKRELRGGDPIRITTQLLGCDAKKMHYVHQMYHQGEGYLAAASEWISIHVDMETRRSAPFPDDIAQHLNDIHTAHAALPVPPDVGRVMSLKAGRAR